MKYIEIKNSDFSELKSFLAIRRNNDKDVSADVERIINDVRLNGDNALLKYSQMFDGVKFGEPSEMEVTRAEIEEAYTQIEQTDNYLIGAIKRAAANIEEFHEHQKEESFIYDKEPGIKLGTLRKPLKTAGIYVPAGTAPLPSSVLMNAIPAKVAGVKEIIMVTPPQKNGKINPAILIAADTAGVTKIYKIGGAQAIAALAYGTETIPKADKITGPGNIYVATAKKMVYGQCNIDMVAGPSEILIVADESSRPDFLAADMLSQAEHDKLASSILIATDPSIISKAEIQLNAQLKMLPRKEVAQSSLEKYGAYILADNMKDVIKAINIIAPEHLELCVENAMDYIDDIENAGAVFIGNYSPEPMGDYYAGPNHILPTTGTARFYSPLNVWDFIKQTSVISYEKEAFMKSADDVIKLARAEELEAHARSVEIRKEEL